MFIRADGTNVDQELIKFNIFISLNSKIKFYCIDEEFTSSRAKIFLKNCQDQEFGEVFVGPSLLGCIGKGCSEASQAREGLLKVQKSIQKTAP